jgi:hypothetical protein
MAVIQKRKIEENLVTGQRGKLKYLRILLYFGDLGTYSLNMAILDEKKFLEI